MAMYDSSLTRLELFKTQHELARNFYDDYEFCPVLCMDEVSEHRERIQQRTSPHSSPSTSPPYSARRAIPIIDPGNGAAVSVPSPSSSSTSSSGHQWPYLGSSNSSRGSRPVSRDAAISAYRAIPIVDPSTRQVVRPQQPQQPDFSAFYGLSVR